MKEYRTTLLCAFFASLLIHAGILVYLDRTPWKAEAISMNRPRHDLLRIELLDESEIAELNARLAKESKEAFPLASQVIEIPEEEEMPESPLSFEEDPPDAPTPTDPLSVVPLDRPDQASLHSSPIGLEIVKIPEPLVEVPEPESRVWIPKGNEIQPLPELAEEVLSGVPEISPSVPFEAGDDPVLPLFDQEPAVSFLPVDGVVFATETLRDLDAGVVDEPAPPPSEIEEIVHWDEFLEVELTAHRPTEAPGWFQIAIRPNDKANQLRPMPKDVLFALDASESISPAEFEAVAGAVSQSLSILSPGDRFNVLAFKADLVALNSGLWPANEKTFEAARDFIGTLEPSGKTDIYRSLSAVVRSLPGGDRPFLIVLCSDGNPTVGLRDSAELIDRLSRENRLRAGIHAFGVGENNNRYLLQLLAYRNKGLFAMGSSPQEIASNLEAFLYRISDPLLMNILVNLAGFSREEIHPRVLPDLYRGGEIRLFGRYSVEREMVLRLAGNVRGKHKDFMHRDRFPDAASGNRQIVSRWAQALAHDLITPAESGEPSTDDLAKLEKLINDYGLDIPWR